MSRLEVLTGRLENAIEVMNQLSKVVVGNLRLKGSDQTPQLDDNDQDAILCAITLISSQAHDDFCELTNEYPPGPKESRGGT